MVGENGSDAYRERLNQPESRERIASSLEVEKIVDFLVEHANITDEVVDTDEDEAKTTASKGNEADA